MSIQESGENGSFMVTIWLLSKYGVVLMVALSLLSEQYEGSFLATKLCSQTTPVKNNPPEEEAAASRAPIPCVPWPRRIRKLDGEPLTGRQALAHDHGAVQALPRSPLGWVAWDVMSLLQMGKLRQPGGGRVSWDGF